MPRKIEISHRTIIFTVLFLLSIWVLYQVREIITAIFVAVILMSALNPLVDRLERMKFPRWSAILCLYLLVFGVLGATVAILLPPVVDQTTGFINRIPFYLEDLGNLGIDQNLFASQISQLGLLPSNILRFAVDIFSNIVSIFFLAMITFYLLLERKNLHHHLLLLFAEEESKKIEGFINKAERQLGGWVRGEVILMTTIGVMTYFGLMILGVEFALPLAILAGFLELVPNIGPVIAAIPAVLVGLTISPLSGLAVAALYLLIQQLENNLIVPKVMERVVGVNPLIIILALSVGFKLGGAGGAILALPILLIGKLVFLEIAASKKFRELVS